MAEQTYKLIFEDGVPVIVPCEELDVKPSRAATEDEGGMLEGIEDLIKSQEPEEEA